MREDHASDAPSCSAGRLHPGRALLPPIFARMIAVVGALAFLMAGCGGSTKTVTPPAGVPTGGTAVHGGSTAAGALGGHTADTYTCDSFPATDVLAAVQTAAPKTTAGSFKTERAGDKYGPLQCIYQLQSNLKSGIDPSVAADVEIEITLTDEVIDGVPAYHFIKEGFDKESARLHAAAKGDASSDIQSLFVPVSGIGAEAYFDDYFTRDAGINRQVRSDMKILRSSLPVTVKVNLSYGPQPDSSIPVPAVATDPFQNDTRHMVVEAVAKFVLAKL